ncbi:hypothetical protein C1646_761095 [Rhizophagus diaphanus]|nr:hypothetical protein C1646_761095 [Rhizophagus diaphanus] [Rhizophagus sp. MUCL 43196]
MKAKENARFMDKITELEAKNIEIKAENTRLRAELKAKIEELESRVDATTKLKELRRFDKSIDEIMNSGAKHETLYRKIERARNIYRKIPVKSNQDDQTNASVAQANTSISAKKSVSTESRLPELNPKEPFIIKNKSDRYSCPSFATRIH